MNKADEETQGLNFSSDKLLGYICRHCLKLFKSSKKNREHNERVHIGPAKCTRCQAILDDILELASHKKACGFPCGVNGCNLIHKSLKLARNHKKRFEKTML